ncbi:MAG: tetratricopeptide repeat protein [Gemmatimonadaceae bacterium]
MHWHGRCTRTFCARILRNPGPSSASRSSNPTRTARSRCFAGIAPLSRGTRGDLWLRATCSRAHRSRRRHSAYDRAARVAPDERDVALGRARLLVRAGRGAEAREVLERWTAHQPADSRKWDLLGRELSRAGKPSGSLARLSPSGPDGAFAAAQHLAAAPSFEPTVSWQRDSDGNLSLAFGGGADVLLVDGLRFGVAGHHGVVQRIDVAAIQRCGSAAPAPTSAVRAHAGQGWRATVRPDRDR